MAHSQNVMQEKFGFLQQCKMLVPYQLILCLARSVTDLEKLHGFLPENCRLIRDDLIAFKQFWQLLYDNNPPNSGSRLPNGAAKALLISNCYKWGLTPNYIERLDHGREKLPDNPIPGSPRILTSPERCGNGYDHFTASVNRIPMEIGCFVRDDGNKIEVRFTVWQSALTESVIYALKSVVAFSTAAIGNRESRISSDFESSGVHVDFWLSLPTTALLEHTKKWKNPHVSPDSYEYIADSGFPRALEQELIALGIPVSEILAIE